MTAARRSNAPRLAVLVLLLLLCLLVSSFFFILDQAPEAATRRFGPPSARLSQTQRITYSLRLLWNQTDLLDPVDRLGQPRPFVIEFGESVSSISMRLQDLGLVHSADTFSLYLTYAGLDTGVQAGQRQLSPAMNAIQIARALQDATPQDVSFRILPGWRVEEIAAALPVYGLQISEQDFLRSVHAPNTRLLPAGDWLQGGSLEGFLLPDTYSLRREAKAEDVVSLFVQRFDQQVTPEMRQAFQRNGLDVRQAVTMASLVQREAVLVDEQPIIASVFYNRLAAGINLASDPTIQYAIGYNTIQGVWWSNPLTAADLQINSPYNTYQNPGLPPGPICNPGLPALRAVAYPAQTPYYYFRARCDQSGQHNFAETYEQHLQNGCP